MEKKGIITDIIAAIVLCIIGGGILYLGRWMGNEGNDFMKNAVKTKATIIRIESNHTSAAPGRKTSKTSSCFVTYTVNGREYENKLLISKGDMHVGKKVTIYYDPDNPYLIGQKEENVMVYLVYFFGAGFVLVGVLLIRGGIKKLRQ